MHMTIEDAHRIRCAPGLFDQATESEARRLIRAEWLASSHARSAKESAARERIIADLRESATAITIATGIERVKGEASAKRAGMFPPQAALPEPQEPRHARPILAAFCLILLAVLCACDPIGHMAAAQWAEDHAN